MSLTFTVENKETELIKHSRISKKYTASWVFFELGQNGLSLSWVWVGFNPVKLLKIHYKDCHYAASWVGVFPGKPY